MMIGKAVPDEIVLAKHGIKGLELKEFRKKMELLKIK